jgi:hypothetical protein
VKINHWYYWITSAVFVLLGLLMIGFELFLPAIPPGFPPQLYMAIDTHFGWIIFAWGMFRGINGYWIFKRNTKELEESKVQNDAARD